MKNRFISIFVLAAVFCGSLALPTAAHASSGCTPYAERYVSDSSVQVAGGGSAVPTYQSPLWTPPFSGATWIWSTPFVSDPNNGETQTFTLTFTLPGMATSSQLRISADDYYVLTINGTEIDSQTGEGNFLPNNIHTYQDPSVFVAGTNTVVFTVTNAPYFYTGQGTETTNPAGLMFDLSIDGENCPAAPAAPTSSGGGSTTSWWYVPPVSQTTASSAPGVVPTEISAAPLAAGHSHAAALPGIVAGTSSETTTGTSSQANTELASVAGAGIRFSPVCFLVALLLLVLIIVLWLVGSRFFKNWDERAQWRGELVWYGLAAIAVLAILAVVDRCPIPYFLFGMVLLVVVRTLMRRK